VSVVVDAEHLDLARFLRRGDRIVWSQACGEPISVVEALLAQAGSIGDLSAFAATSFSGVIDGPAADKLQIDSLGAIASVRPGTHKRPLGIVPTHLSQVAQLIETGLIGCDVAIVQVSPPDANGEHSFGLTHDYVRTAVAKARVVIAEVNEKVPFTFADATLPSACIDCAVRTSRGPLETPPAPPGEVDLAIARRVAGYIGDGAVVQTGIGATPEAILRELSDRRDLGIQSGMLGDGVVDLIEAGVVTNALKPIDRGVSIAGVLMGTRRLYDFADRNPKLAMRSTDYTHNPAVLSRIPNLVAVNSALEVDLTGQVNAEQSGELYIGRTGGQVDFVRAAAASPGGRSIIALPSTARGGELSRIVGRLSGPVTTARSDADLVVTEFGAAELKGQTLTERARRLVAIAHPQFREALDRSAWEIARRGF